MRTRTLQDAALFCVLSGPLAETDQRAMLLQGLLVLNRNRREDEITNTARNRDRALSSLGPKSLELCVGAVTPYGDGVCSQFSIGAVEKSTPSRLRESRNQVVNIMMTAPYR
ncbi:hypothetical protein CCM_06242 [Cordyceps militaris CM01]|uniref:Uncharacterized protein n=1 Tax=Cordyceps militaris (strain CM01) TaxID=983644 RepID=G3JJJ4_CORMM|nr:uncharacterized protein CCM_06242 [Cordyceps militaris CM01]EGX92082.1 hypothetical protein CCM_06242 [Cordyceps militaris CM01]